MLSCCRVVVSLVCFVFYSFFFVRCVFLLLWRGCVVVSMRCDIVLCCYVLVMWCCCFDLCVVFVFGLLCVCVVVVLLCRVVVLW